MANRNIYQSLLHPDLKVQRNGFDLSHRKLFTAKAGELIPVLCEDMIPGDYFEVDTATLLRSMPLNTAAFVRCKMIFDFFFVPKTAIWSRWNDFISQRTDKRSSYTQSAAYEPQISVGGIQSALSSNTVNSSTDVINGLGARAKIAQMLGYGYYENVSYTGDYATRTMSALPLFGYNFIFNNFYRNPWRDEPNAYEVKSANADFLSCDTFAHSVLSSYDTPYLVRMRYRGWNKDLFMGSLPNQQFGSVSSIEIGGVTSSDVGRWTATGNTDLASGANVITSSSNSLLEYVEGVGNKSIAHTHSFTGSSFDVVSLRRAIALQKWKEYNMRAGYRNSNQQKAQFGVGLPQDVRHELDFIDSYEQSVMVDEVISTANTSSPDSGNGNLAEIAGKGIGFSNGKKISYEAKQHGYLYCIFSVVPEAEYDAAMIDKSLIKSEPFDHYNPAFENVGMQPIHGYELQYGRNSYPDNVLGYAPNFYEYKTRLDKVYGEMMFFTGYGSGGALVPGTLNAWSSHREDLILQFGDTGYLTTRNFYIVPNCLDAVFLQGATHKSSTDQFIVDLNFDTKAVRPMSVLGLPQI